jgi:hypothetical protein
LRATSGNVNGETERDAGRREKRKPPVLEASASDPAFILKDENNNNNKKKSASSLLELESESSRYTSTSSKGGEKKKKVSKVEEATSRQSLRTQLTSGIQATTSTLDLPEPQVAVRNLMEYARHAHMSTVMSKAQHRRADYPFGSIVEFAVDGSGHPVFAMSSLAIHTRNVLSNPRCAIQIQAPGWTGLNNARVTLFGDVFPVDPGSAQDASDLFTAKREKMGAGQNSKKNNLSFNNNKGANMRYFVMSNLVDILFVGGYGTVKWIKPKDYHEAEPDFILQDLANTIKTCNELFGEAIKVEIPEADDVSFISVDKRGVELRVREGIEDSVRRLRFTENCFTRQDVCEQLRELIKG